MEIIVAAFQHLQSCKVTHLEDIPLIKEQLVAHYNNRRISAYGKLLTALNKFFDVEFVVRFTGSLKTIHIVCKPFFAEPNWMRLPSLDDRAPIMGGRGGPSLFAIPPDELKESGLGSPPIKYTPYLRISLPNVKNIGSYLKGFVDCPDWKQYVVNPSMSLKKGDHFPSIDHVIHTVLERPPGFFVSEDSSHLAFYLSG